MLTLKAAGLLDVDAGEILRPGILKIEDDRIVGVGGEVAQDGPDQVAPGVGFALGAQADRNHREQRRVRQGIVLEQVVAQGTRTHRQDDVVDGDARRLLDALDAFQRP